jgi:hypothetical protein
MNIDDVAELERLEALASPGPWGPAHGKVKEQDALLIAALRTHAKELLRMARATLEARQ